MAKPIKHTPVLRGRDAANFLAIVDQNKDKKVDKQTLANIRQSAQQLKSIFRN